MASSSSAAASAPDRHLHPPPSSVTRRVQQHQQLPSRNPRDRRRPTSAAVSSSSSSPRLVRMVPLYIAASVLVVAPLLAIFLFHTSTSNSPPSSASSDRPPPEMARLGGAFGPPAADGLGHNSDSSSSSSNHGNEPDCHVWKHDVVQVLLVSTSVTGLSLTATWWFPNGRIEVPLASLQAGQADDASPSGTAAVPANDSDVLRAARWVVDRDVALGGGKEESDAASWVVLGRSDLLPGPANSAGASGGGRAATLHTVLHFLTPAERGRLQGTERQVLALTTHQVMEAILTTRTPPPNNSPPSADPTPIDTTTLASLALGFAHVQTQTREH